MSHDEEQESSPSVEEPWEQLHHPEPPGKEGWQKKSLDPQVVDMPIVPRTFHLYETHYAEEPFLLINPDSPPPIVYESSDFEQIVVEEAEKLAPEEECTQLVVSVVDETIDDAQGAAEGKTSIVIGGGGISGAKVSPVDASDVGDDDSKVCGAMGKEKKDLNSNQIVENGQAVSLGPSLSVCFGSLLFHPTAPALPF